jgi:nitrous oxide reductase accessory protein NosL
MFGFSLSACILAVAFSAIAANQKPCCGLPAKQPAVATAAVGSDVKTYADCKYCGMSREKFSFSRILIEYDDGTVIGLCSIHCAAVDLANKLDRTPKSIKVGEYNSRELIDAEKAFWVIGGTKQGVMTKQAKWAFAKKYDAEKFIKEYGGTLATFDQVMKAAYDDMYQETKMLREKRKMMRMKMEKK